jgi:hypothetical protein
VVAAPSVLPSRAVHIFTSMLSHISVPEGLLFGNYSFFPFQLLSAASVNNTRIALATAEGFNKPAKFVPSNIPRHHNLIRVVDNL